MATFLFQPTPHREAAKFISGKPVVSREVFDMLLPELKARAFTIAGVECASVVQGVRDAIAGLPEGGDWEEIKERIVKDVLPYFVDPAADAETQAAQTRAGERRAELLLRTHGQQAYAAAAYAVADEQRDLFPFWQYQTLGDGAVRDTHRALDGIVLPHDHPFWKSHTPPWEWGCRCQFIPLSEDDVAEIAAEDKALPPEKRRVLGEAERKLLAEGRTIHRDLDGNGARPYYVGSPAEDGKPGAFKWHPSDLRISLDDLKARFDEQTWTGFETWAKKTKLTGKRGTTVWQWLAGKPKPAPQPEPAPAPQEWPALDTLKRIKKLGGSTGAELWQAPDGRQFVLKRGANAEHLREEVTADQLYTALGVPVPRHTLIETPQGPVKLAEFIQGRTLTAQTAARHRDQIAQHFAADALLGNWDVAGMSFDNLLIDDAGKVWRIDNGGSLRFRAQGAKKTATEWDEFPRELWTLRNAAKNAQTATVFGHLGIYDTARQIEKLDGAALLAAAPAELRTTLEARLNNMRAVSRKALDMEADKWKGAYADDLTRHMIGLRAEGIIAALPKKLTGNPGDVIVRDENGEPFDHLRTLHKHAAKKTAVELFHDAIVPAAKTINAHHAKGDTAYNQAKLDAAEAKRPELKKLLQSGTAAEKKLAQHYLDALDAIATAKGDAKKTVPMITTPSIPGLKAPPAAESLVTKLAAYMKKEGGDWKHIEDWAGAQAGSSQSKEAAAYKFFLFSQLEGASPDDFFRKPSQAAFEAVVPDSKKAAYTTTFTAHHAFIQELLAATSFEGNDTNAHRMRILRTEATAAVVPFAKGKRGQYKRGVNESGSILRPVFSGTKTVTNVPHSRITSIYFLERSPGAGGSFLYGDSENEATYIAWGLDAWNGGKDYLNTNPGTDSTKWEL